VNNETFNYQSTPEVR